MIEKEIMNDQRRFDAGVGTLWGSESFYNCWEGSVK